MKKVLIVFLVFLNLVCFVSCNNTSLIVCPKCGYENSNDAKFCSDCGAALVLSNDDNQVISETTNKGVAETETETETPKKYCFFCGVREIPQNSAYCDSCKCLSCDGVRANEYTLYCDMHACKHYHCPAPACLDYRSSPLNYCAAHKCAMPDCSNEKLNNSTICAHH